MDNIGANLNLIRRVENTPRTLLHTPDRMPHLQRNVNIRITLNGRRLIDGRKVSMDHPQAQAYTLSDRRINRQRQPYFSMPLVVDFDSLHLSAGHESAITSCRFETQRRYVLNINDKPQTVCPSAMSMSLCSSAVPSI